MLAGLFGVMLIALAYDSFLVNQSKFCLLEGFDLLKYEYRVQQTYLPTFGRTRSGQIEKLEAVPSLLCVCKPYQCFYFENELPLGGG